MDAIALAAQEIAQENPALQFDLLIQEQESLGLGYQKGQVRKFESAVTVTAGFRVISHDGIGYAFTENLSPVNLKSTFEEAKTNAFLFKNKSSQFQLPHRSKSEFIEKFDIAEPNIQEQLQVAQNLESIPLSLNSKIETVPYSGYSNLSSKFRILNSNGIDRNYTKQVFSIYTAPLIKENGKSKCVGKTLSSLAFKDLDPSFLSNAAVDEEVQLLKAQKLETGNYPVILSSEIAPLFISMLISYFSAKTLDKGESLLSGKINQRIAPPGFDLIDEPSDYTRPYARPFDSEGSQTKKNILIENGIFKTFLTDLEYSQKLNLPHTSSAIRSPQGAMDMGPNQLVLKKGKHTFDFLKQLFPRSILITQIDGGMHAGFKKATGDFSLPAQGFLLEKGEEPKAVDEFVVSGNIINLLQNIVAIADEHSIFSGQILAPALAIQELSFSGR